MTSPANNQHSSPTGPAHSTALPETLPFQGTIKQRRWLPILILVLLPFLVQVPLWLTGRSADPIWFTSGITHSTAGFSGYPQIDPNVGSTSEALGRLAAWDWVHGIVPWWNPYTGIGVPLAGELQPGSFFLPFVLLFLLPNGILWLQILIQILTGLATYALLRELGLSRLAATMGGAVFSLNGTIAWVPGPAAVYYSLPFLPLLIWGIEQARKVDRGAVSILAIGTAIAFSILPGFPEPAYVSGLLAVVWGVWRLTGEIHRWRMLRRALTGFFLGLLVALPPLIAFADYSLQSDSFAVHKLGERALPWAAFTMTFLPYAFGPIEYGVQSKPLGHIWDLTGGYAGIVIILLAIAGLAGKCGPRGLKILLAAWVLVCWAKSFGLQPIMGLLNYIPLVRQTQFYRYSHPSWIFALIVLAAFALDNFSADLQVAVPRRRIVFGVTLAFLIAAIALGWPMRAFWERPSARLPVMFLLMAASVAWAVAGLAAIAFAWTRLHGQRRRLFIATVTVVDAAVLFMAPFVSSVHGIGVDTSAVRFLRDHQGLSRSFTFAPFSPNYPAYFQIANIDHTILPVPRLWQHYIEQQLLPGYAPDGVTFTPFINDEGAGEQSLNTNLQHYLDLSVRYILTDPGKSLLRKTYMPGRNAIPVISAQKSFSFLSRVLHRGHPAASPLATAAVADDDKVRLLPTQSATTASASLPPGPAGVPISSIAIALLNEHPSITGHFGNDQLAVTLCSGTTCRSGRRPLSAWQGTSSFEVPLDQPLPVTPGAPMHLTLTRQAEAGASGATPLTLWLGPPTFAGQTVQGPAGPYPHHDLQLIFEYGDPIPGSRKVYSDSIMDIWELAHPAPYFEVTQGGPCTFSNPQREHLALNCASPATLRRRELFMPGWQASAGNEPHAVTKDGIFQAVPVPAGVSTVTWRFVPPHMAIGWAACFTGLAGLLWQVLGILRNRRRL